MIQVVLYIAGAALCFLVFMVPMLLLAGIASVAIFYRSGRKRHMGVDRPTELGLDKNQMMVLLYAAGIAVLLSLYTIAFLLVVNR
jgi:hypothetical protein